MLEILRLDTTDPDFGAQLDRLLARGEETDHELRETVRKIVDHVRRGGDKALLEYTRRFDRLEAESAAALEIPQSRLRAALDHIPREQRQALEHAAARIRACAERQTIESWEYTDPDGNRLGQRVTPLDRAGLYVPGGKAAYPSSLLMNAIPARVAGVGELIATVPTPDGAVNDLVLAVAALAEVDRVFTVGGAQAIAALAYGTATIPRVDKIVGPGNKYVAAAQREVFGAVGIDRIAGPTDVLVICDGSANPEWIAMDLFAQAEHDEDAGAALLCPGAEFLESVAAAMDRLVSQMTRAEIIRAAMKQRGALIRVRDLDEAAALANRFAPEHLQLAVAEPEELVKNIRHAGAIFMGHYSPEVLGDYCAGPNHVLPTGRTARFCSPLGVYDFQKRSSTIHCTRPGAAALAGIAAKLAYGEGLTAHARSAEYRLYRDR